MAISGVTGLIMLASQLITPNSTLMLWDAILYAYAAVYLLLLCLVPFHVAELLDIVRDIQKKLDAD